MYSVLESHCLFVALIGDQVDDKSTRSARNNGQATKSLHIWCIQRDKVREEGLVVDDDAVRSGVEEEVRAISIHDEGNWFGQE